MIRRSDFEELLNSRINPIYYRTVSITNNESSDLSDYQVSFEIGGDFLNKADPNRLFIVDSNNNILPYWVEEWKYSNGKARIWIKVNLTASDTNYFNLYYGDINRNPQNGNEVFEFFDDFDNDSLNTNKWNVSGTISIQDSCVLINENDYIYTKSNYSSPLIIECKAKANEQDVQIIGFNAWSLDSDNYFELEQSDYPSSSDGDYTYVRQAGMVSGSGGTNDANFHLSLLDWHNYKLVIYSGHNKGYQDNNLIHDETTNVLTGNYPITHRTWNSSQESTLYVDWTFVRKYTTNEPTISISSEKIQY